MAIDARAAHTELIHRTRAEALLASCAELLAWDEETYLPARGIEHRAGQVALLAGLQHQRATDPRLGDLLYALEQSELVVDPDSPSAVNVRELRRLYERAARLPRRLMEEIAKVVALAQQEWASAREQNSFSRFRPWLERVVRLRRQEAEYLNPKGPLYDALLDEYEPGAKSADIASLFTALRAELVPLAGAIANARKKPDTTILHRECPLDRQRAFGEHVAGALGFDFRAGRLDTAIHPFSTGIGPGDCRITTRFQLHDFCAGFFTIIHEVGHGLYEQGLDPEQYGTPMGEAVSTGMHESQARLWENLVGRSRAFWEYLLPQARRMLPEVFGDVSLDALCLAINNVAPSLLRVQADEVTYNLHVLIRFELERDLIAGELQAADVPAAWNEAYRRCLGIVPPDDTLGCLQDGHWAAGQIGYFPTYTLGNIFGAQLFARASADLGALDEAFARGDFSGLVRWLREHVHRHGSRYPAAQLIERTTGSPPSPRPLLEYLRRKYGSLYKIG